MRISRMWDRGNHNTFSIPSIKELLRLRLRGCDVIVDPFARNSSIGTMTNDLNPNTSARYHMDAKEFLAMLIGNGERADAVLFDPPYSRRQMKEMYQGIGLEYTNAESQEFTSWSRVKDLLAMLCEMGGVSISFGWNSAGLGKRRGFRIEEVLLVHHGEGHHDTIVVVESKINQQYALKESDDIWDGQTPKVVWSKKLGRVTLD